MKCKESKSETHSGCKREREHVFDEIIVELVEGTDSEVSGQLKHKTASGCLRLICHNISTSAYSMSHVKMPLLNNP